MLDYLVSSSFIFTLHQIMKLVLFCSPVCKLIINAVSSCHVHFNDLYPPAIVVCYVKIRPAESDGVFRLHSACLPDI